MTKETKEMLMNLSKIIYIEHVPLFWNGADPVKPLNSYSAQINFDITIWNGSCLGMANTSCNWCQKKEDKLNFVTMSTFSDNSLQFWEKLTWFMGFLFSGTSLYNARAKSRHKQRVNSKLLTILHIFHHIILPLWGWGG